MSTDMLKRNIMAVLSTLEELGTDTTCSESICYIAIGMDSNGWIETKTNMLGGNKPLITIEGYRVGLTKEGREAGKIINQALAAAKAAKEQTT